MDEGEEIDVRIHHPIPSKMACVRDERHVMEQRPEKERDGCAAWRADSSALRSKNGDAKWSGNEKKARNVIQRRSSLCEGEGG